MRRGLFTGRRSRSTAACTWCDRLRRLKAGSIVFNDPELTVANRSLHTIRFSSPASGRPDVFDAADLDFLRSSSGVFARKFDSTNSDLLDHLDNVIAERHWGTR